MGVFCIDSNTLYFHINIFHFCEGAEDCYPDKQVHQLQRLSDTRWACQQSAVHAICTTFDLLLVTLEILEDDDDQSTAVEARAVYYSRLNVLNLCCH